MRVHDVCQKMRAMTVLIEMPLLRVRNVVKFVCESTTRTALLNPRRALDHTTERIHG